MGLYWVAKCNNCGKESAIRPSQSAGVQLDMATPSEKINAECPHCKFKNEFRGADLREVAAYIAPSPPQSEDE
jgi:DNA-directed RNA polymerase subunit RPC12/RpoP